MWGRGGWRAVALVVALFATACAPEWTTYHKDNARSGADPSAPSITPVANAWTSPFLDGFVFAQPLVYKNRVYVATEHNTIYALDLGSGSVVWKQHLAEPFNQAAANVPCRLNIDPLGITGTPVIDPSTNTIYAVIQTGPPSAHALVGLDTETGAGRVLASADPAGVDPIHSFNRPALALGNDRVYWAYGGSDCGTYHGTVVSVRTDGTSPLVYTVPSTNRGSFWSPSGAAIDPAGNVWVTSGDGKETTTFDHTSTLIKLSPTLQELGYFTPSNWAQINAGGLDLGSAGPTLLPNGLVFQAGKNKEAFLVSQSNPGGIGGQLASLPTGCLSLGGDATNAGVVYMPCTTGMLALAVDSGPALRQLWKGPSDTTGSPVFGGNTVWNIGVDSGTLYALNPADGKVVQSISVGHARHFTSPTIAGDTVIVATDHTVEALRHASG
jgi:outer membrane protein assembly factor BamB